MQIKKIANALASVGSPITLTEHIESIFEGLDDEYEGFITSMLNRESPYIIGDLESLLMAQEERLNKKKKVPESLAVNVVHNGEKKNQYQGTRQQNFVPRGGGNGSFHGSNNNAHGGSNGRGRGRGGRSSGNTNNKLIFQLCGNTGHMAFQCYFRFDEEFTSPFASLPTNSSDDSKGKNTMMMVASEALFDPTWFPDSGASCHVTPDVFNLQSVQHYDGSDLVYIGDGK